MILVTISAQSGMFIWMQKMIDVAIIPARAGSVGLKGKNIKLLGGHPLINWTIRAALLSKSFKKVIVSTDSSLIAETSAAAGAEIPFIRPAALATSDATSDQVLRHALNSIGETSTFALLQPTSPFRSSYHINSAAFLFHQHNPEAVISVTPAKPISWQLKMDKNKWLHKALEQDIVKKRQEGMGNYLPNGAIYICRTEKFLKNSTVYQPKTIGYEMALIDSIDIDNPEDFEIAEALIHSGLRKWED